MPIADCGFPPISFLPGLNPDSDQPRVISGREMLVMTGPTAAVEIGFNADLFHADPAVVQQAINSAHAQPLSQLVEALIDTGASESCIDEDLARHLELPLIDHQVGSGIGGKETFNVYLGHVRIAALGFIQYGRFMGVKLAAGSQPHQALLGRTLLQGMILVYDGRDGSVRLAV
ncbi:MAG TPA: aspartyl protease family protein [Thermoanaerobaculia bacterium]|nr:aspartyl protease family protein [Thermoanaerobaculia bacterium]